MCVFLAQKQQKTEGIKKPESIVDISTDSGLELVVRIEPLRRFAPRGAPAALLNYSASVFRLRGKTGMRSCQFDSE
jgi:hypothetical protein